MTKRDVFSDDEWRTLVFTPLVVFYAVAYADGSISRLETGKLTAMIDNGTKLTGPNTELAREVFTFLKPQFGPAIQALEASIARGESFDSLLAAARALLDRKVPPAEAAGFKQIMVTVGAGIAEAAPLFGPKVTAEERVSVERIRVSLGAP